MLPSNLFIMFLINNAFDILLGGTALAPLAQLNVLVGLFITSKLNDARRKAEEENLHTVEGTVDLFKALGE